MKVQVHLTSNDIHVDTSKHLTTNAVNTKAQSTINTHEVLQLENSTTHELPLSNQLSDISSNLYIDFNLSTAGTQSDTTQDHGRIDTQSDNNAPPWEI